MLDVRGGGVLRRREGIREHSRGDGILRRRREGIVAEVREDKILRRREGIVADIRGHRISRRREGIVADIRGDGISRRSEGIIPEIREDKIPRRSSEIAPAIREEAKHETISCSASWIQHTYQPRCTGRQKNGDAGGMWRYRLLTLEQYQYESSVHKPANRGPRLVDQIHYAQNFDLWLELIRFRHRHHGVKGLQSLFKEIQNRDLRIPVHGNVADELWDLFLRLGWETGTMWSNVIPYARKLRAATKRSWSKLYFRVLSYCLRDTPQKAVQWHAKLYNDFPPSLEQMKQIFDQAATTDAALAAFKRMYTDRPIPNMYATVIHRLCNLGKHEEAVRWHHLLTRMNDKPLNSAVAEPLSNYLTVYCNDTRLVETTEEMMGAKASVADPIVHSFRNGQFSSLKMNREHGRTRSAPMKRFGDGFCARLFATKVFSIDTIINGLRILGIDSIGPCSLRELALREQSSPKAICQRIDQLKNTGVSLDNSIFSTLIRSLASKGDGELLKDVVDCDMHPEAFEDQPLQESLLASYQRSGDHQQANRTLAILTIKVLPDDFPGVYWNLLLSSALKRKNLTDVHRILDEMHEHGVSVDRKSICDVRRQLLSVRDASRLPTNTAELPSVIAILQKILQMGNPVPAFEWREFFRRLGMTGQLTELEKLSLWLADWYSNPGFQASQLSVFNRRKVHVPRYLSTNHRSHPLRMIFPPMAQQAIIAWGFKHPARIQKRAARSQNKGLAWRWGIALLRKLKQRTVSIRDSTVSKACELRLKALFREGELNRRVSRQSRAQNIQYLKHLAEEIEKVWGGKLFRVGNLLPTEDPRPSSPVKKMAMRKRVPYKAEKSSQPPQEESGFEIFGCTEADDEFLSGEVRLANWYVDDKTDQNARDKRRQCLHDLT